MAPPPAAELTTAAAVPLKALPQVRPLPVHQAAPVLQRKASSRGNLLEYSQLLSQKVSSLEQEVAQLREERDALEAENKIIGEDLFGLQKENGKLVDSGKMAMAENGQLAAQTQGASLEIGKLRDTVSALSSQIAQMHQELRALQGEREQLSQAVRGHEAAKATLQAELVKRLGQIRTLEQRAGILDRQVEEFRVERSQLDVVVSSQRAEIERLQQKEKELQAEQARSHAMQQKLDATSRELARCRQDKAQLDHTVSTLHVELAQMRTQRDSAASELPALQASLKQQGLIVTELQEQAVHLRRTVHDLHNKNTGLERQMHFAGVESERACGDRAQLEREVSDLHAERTRLQHTLEGLVANKAELDRMLGTAMGEHSLARSEFEQANAEREHFGMQAKQANAEILVLKSRLVGTEKMAQGFQHETASLQERIRLMRVEREQLEERLAQAQQQKQDDVPRSFRAPLTPVGDPLNAL